MAQSGQHHVITVGVVPFHFFKPQNIVLNVWARVESIRTQFARIVRELASVMCNYGFIGLIILIFGMILGWIEIKLCQRYCTRDND